MSTVSYDKSKEVVNEAFDDQDTTWSSQGNSRIGAKVAAGDVAGRFELAMSSNDEDEVALRLMYGEWNFGAGKLLVGQDYTPTDQILGLNVGVLPSGLTSNAPTLDGEGNALGIGSMYNSRRPQIKLKFGGFQLAFIEPQTAGNSGSGGTDVDTTLPQIAASYKFKTDMFSITPYGAYNTYEQTNTATDAGESVDSTLFGVAGTDNIGAFNVKGNVWGGQNTNGLGRAGNVNLYGNAWLTGGTYEDSDQFGGQVFVGFKLNDMLTFEAGYSMETSEITVANVDYESDPTHWYIDAVITLAPGVMIVPEFGIYDLGDNDVGGVATERGDITYFGAKWQINF
jgi:hypothetical protein